LSSAAFSRRCRKSNGSPQGPPGFSDEDGGAVSRSLKRWSRFRFLAGSNRYIQQESTYWRRSLWERAGSIWTRPAGKAAILSFGCAFFAMRAFTRWDALIGGFRVHPDSLGLEDRGKCAAFTIEIIAAELNRTPGEGLSRASSA